MRGSGIALSAILFWLLGICSAQLNPPNPPAQSAAAQALADSSMLVAAPTFSSEPQHQFVQGMKEIHFDFNRADVRDEDHAIPSTDARRLKEYPGLIIMLGVNGDDRGDMVYNRVLSGARAPVTKAQLVRHGIPAGQIGFVRGWNKLYPMRTEQDESSWSLNRR